MTTPSTPTLDACESACDVRGGRWRSKCGYGGPSADRAVKVIRPPSSSGEEFIDEQSPTLLVGDGAFTELAGHAAELKEFSMVAIGELAVEDTQGCDRFSCEASLGAGLSSTPWGTAVAQTAQTADDLSLDSSEGLSGVRSQRAEHSALPPLASRSPVDLSGCSLCDSLDIGESRVEARSEEIEAARAGGERGFELSSSPVQVRLNRHSLGCGRYLQHFFRGARRIRPDCWQTPGGLANLAVIRPVTRPACDHGQSLSPTSEFEAQARRASGLFQWYRQYILLLKRFRSGQTPLVLDLFCKAGGASEGFRRGGASV